MVGVVFDKNKGAMIVLYFYMYEAHTVVVPEVQPYTHTHRPYQQQSSILQCERDPYDSLLPIPRSALLIIIIVFFNLRFVFTFQNVFVTCVEVLDMMAEVLLLLMLDIILYPLSFYL